MQAHHDRYHGLAEPLDLHRSLRGKLFSLRRKRSTGRYSQ